MKLAIFKKDKPPGAGWIRWSDYVEVEANSGDSYAGLASGALPQSKYSKKISYYPFGSLHAAQPLTEVDWMNKIESALDLISRNVIGQAVLRNIPKSVIYPFLPWYQNAYSDVHINPAQWDGLSPGSRIDEVLLHELIHRVDQTNVYKDRYNFSFDGTDFLTVNATNVYSCMLGRALRKDHSDFSFLPDEHFRNPKLHYDQQQPNYESAGMHARDLVQVLSTIKGVWNPFVYWAVMEQDNAPLPSIF